MIVIEVLLRVVSALHALDPAVIGDLPALALTALGSGVLGITVVGLAALAAAVLVLRLVVLLTGAAGPRGAAVSPASPDLVTRIAWSDPDAAGHARPRAPGVVPAV
jgi:hypothetical protein